MRPMIVFNSDVATIVVYCDNCRTETRIKVRAVDARAHLKRGFPPQVAFDYLPEVQQRVIVERLCEACLPYEEYSPE